MPKMPASKLNINNESFSYFAPETLAFGGIAKAAGLSKLPYSVKILLENQMRNLGKGFVEIDSIKATANWPENQTRAIQVLPTGLADSVLKTVKKQENLNLLKSIQQTLLHMSCAPVIKSDDNTLTPDLRIKSAHSSISTIGILNSMGILTIGGEQSTPSQSPVQKYHSVEFKIPAIKGVRLSGHATASAEALAKMIVDTLGDKITPGCHMEFCGPALESINAETRALISALCIEQGASCALFPIDTQTLLALKESDRQQVKDYAHALGLWHEHNLPTPHYSQEEHIQLS